MTIDPRDYDLGELRRGRASDAEDARDADPESTGGDDSRRRIAVPGPRMEFPSPPLLSGDDVSRESFGELYYLQNESGRVDRPYLSELPDGYRAERLVLEWIEYMVLKVGPEQTRKTLAHYRAIDWLDERAFEELEAYTNTFPADVASGDELTPDDHRVSLLYIARLVALGADA